jgi:hypothetical protein
MVSIPSEEVVSTPSEDIMSPPSEQLVSKLLHEIGSTSGCTQQDLGTGHPVAKPRREMDIHYSICYLDSVGNVCVYWTADICAIMAETPNPRGALRLVQYSGQGM